MLLQSQVRANRAMPCDAIDCALKIDAAFAVDGPQTNAVKPRCAFASSFLASDQRLIRIESGQ